MTIRRGATHSRLLAHYTGGRAVATASPLPCHARTPCAGLADAGAGRGGARLPLQRPGLLRCCPSRARLGAEGIAQPAQRRTRGRVPPVAAGLCKGEGARCNGLAPFVRLGPWKSLKSTKYQRQNATPSILRGEAHPLPVSSSTQFRWWRCTKRGGNCVCSYISVRCQATTS